MAGGRALVVSNASWLDSNLLTLESLPLSILPGRCAAFFPQTPIPGAGTIDVQPVIVGGGRYTEHGRPSQHTRRGTIGERTAEEREMLVCSNRAIWLEPRIPIWGRMTVLEGGSRKGERRGGMALSVDKEKAIKK